MRKENFKCRNCYYKNFCFWRNTCDAYLPEVNKVDYGNTPDDDLLYKEEEDVEEKERVRFREEWFRYSKYVTGEIEE